MRTIFNYFRQVFCKHTFTYQDAQTIKKDPYERRMSEWRYVYCSKCGYHSSHEKFKY